VILLFFKASDGMKTIFIYLGLIVLCLHVNGQTRIELEKNFPKIEQQVNNLPGNDSLWVFIMAGQSNMAGRGYVESSDTLFNRRIITINRDNEWIYAKEPLHLYQPELTGLDCGLSFATELLRYIPKHITIALIPTAVGGSSIDKWTDDTLYKGMYLKSNFMQKVDLAKSKGQIKAILWHQGESDATDEKIPRYENRLKELFSFFREYINTEDLPVIVAELGQYSDQQKYGGKWNQINTIIHKVANEQPFTFLVATGDLYSNSDRIHFNGPSQRELGRRFCFAFINGIENIKKQK